MYKLTINDQEGYEKPYFVRYDWKVGELIGSLMPTFNDKVTVTVEAVDNKKPEGTDD